MMKYTKALVAAAMFTAITAHSAHAADTEPKNTGSKSGQVQIAENIPVAVPAESRNITAIRKAETNASDGAATGDAGKEQPPGTQALMALGIALIITPDMFGGAFSN